MNQVEEEADSKLGRCSSGISTRSSLTVILSRGVVRTTSGCFAVVAGDVDVVFSVALSSGFVILLISKAAAEGAVALVFVSVSSLTTIVLLSSR